MDPDFYFGRIGLISLEGEVTEQLGGALEAVGAAIVPGERRPKAMDLTLPVRGSSHDLNPYLDGDRLRRQLRSLIENERDRKSVV